MRIADRLIAPGAPVFLSVELGVTPNGDLKRALELIDACAHAGADAAKFIVTDADVVMTDREQMFAFHRMRGETPEIVYEPIYDLLKHTQFTFDEWVTIRDHCHLRGLIFYATADHLAAVDMLEALQVPAYKLCAWDIAYQPLIDTMRETHKPILVDVGTATREEVNAAIPIEENEANPDSKYLFVHAPHPHGAKDWNMERVSGFFRPGHPFGFSSPGRDSWCDFVALGGGACLLEKRLTFRRDEPTGHHHAISLEPDEFRDWVRQIRFAETTLREDAFAATALAWEERTKYDRGPDGRRP